MQADPNVKRICRFPLARSVSEEIVLIVPPVAKPCEPMLGAYSLARILREHGISCTVIDSNQEWFNHRLWGKKPDRDSEGTDPRKDSPKRYLRALHHIERGNPLKDKRTYQNRDRYGQAVEHLETALRPAGGDSRDEAPGLADYRVAGLRPVSRRDLIDYAGRSDTLFDRYLQECLLGRIADIRPRVIGFSLTFLHQVFATVRIASIIRDRHPDIRLVLGGALVECWQQQHTDWTLPPFHLFDEVVGTGEDMWKRLERLLGCSLPPPYGIGFIVSPEDLPEDAFFSPERIVPLAFGMGCAWGKCTFCPDYRKHPYQPAAMSAFLDTLESHLRSNFPLVLHLTDSCVPPDLLDALSQAIIERAWPVRWYAFVRFQKTLLEPGRMDRWAKGGCGLLQFGMESAAAGLLKKMQKGLSVSTAADILAISADAGIRNFVYLLFGFPGETDRHRKHTLDFVVAHQHDIHYLNNAVFSLPKNSPIASHPRLFGIRELLPMAGEDSDLSLYLDFLDDSGPNRMRARQFLQETFLAESAVRRGVRALPPVFKSNHAILAKW